MHALSSAFVVALLGAGVMAQSDPAAKVAALKTAATKVDRFKILSQDSDVSPLRIYSNTGSDTKCCQFVFDFNSAPPALQGGDGYIVAANVASFPALTGESSSTRFATV